MTLPFRLGVGGPLGDPRAYLSWIALDDALDVIWRCLTDERAVGPINAVSGSPPQAELAQALGRVLGRPSSVRVPNFALRVALGTEQADGLLSSARVEPRRLRALGHEFRFTDLEAALRHALGKAKEA